MTLNELNAAIIKWADDREITKHSTPYAQAFKTAEEVQELIEAVAESTVPAGAMSGWYTDEIEDAIGDVYVTLVVGMACCQTEPRDINCLANQGPSGQKDPVAQLQKELIPLGRFAPKEDQVVTVFYYSAVGLMMANLGCVAQQYGTTLEACVEQAYNTIKDRRGRLLPNGIFVKEE